MNRAERSRQGVNAKKCITDALYELSLCINLEIYPR